MPSNVLRSFLTALLFFASQLTSAQFSEKPVLMTESQKGNQISIFSQIAPLEINQIHSWLLRLTDPQGRPLNGATIEVVGGMPEHDHGLPTQPQITAETEPGVYLLEGVRFHMPGKWQMTISIQHNTTTDTALLDFQL